MMRKQHEYRRFAAECLKLADASKDAATRAVLVQMASVWSRLASEEQPSDVKDEPDD